MRKENASYELGAAVIAKQVQSHVTFEHWESDLPDNRNLANHWHISVFIRNGRNLPYREFRSNPIILVVKEVKPSLQSSDPNEPRMTRIQSGWLLKYILCPYPMQMRVLM